jgi:HK97 family phage major capsid protein
MATPDPDLIGLGDFYVDPSDIAVDLSNSRKFSVVQQLGRQVAFGPAGGRWLDVDDVQGGFVGAEGGRKPIWNPTTQKGDMAVREWAVVIPLPKRLVRFNPQGAVERIRARIPEAYARAFDDLAFTGAGVGGQSNLNTAVTQTVSLGANAQADGGLWSDFNDGLEVLLKATGGPRRLTGTVLDAILEPVINRSTDTTGQPVWASQPVGPSTAEAIQVGRLINRPARLAESIATGSGATKVVGYMGDWERLLWGQIGAMEFFVSQEGTYVDDDGTTHSAVQENLILFRAEALLGIHVADEDAFVKVLAGSTSAAS